MTERTIHEMLKDIDEEISSSRPTDGTDYQPEIIPPIDEGSAIQSGHLSETSRPVKTHSLSLRNHSAPTTPTSPTNPHNGTSKIDTIKNWSISTYKCTRQLMLEKLGKSQRTRDAHMEAQIEQLRETQRKYLSILRLTRAFSSHFKSVVVTQHALAEAFADLAQKSPELQEEFNCNSEIQRNVTKNGELLLNALNFFISSVNTLCNKTIDDTLLTIRQYETARVEFDAYRMDLENTKPEATQSSISEETQKNYTRQKELYEKLRADVAVKMQFLDENRIKVMHKQLVLLHNAIAAYFSGNASVLENTLKQFNVKLKVPNAITGSWLEQ